MKKSIGIALAALVFASAAQADDVTLECPDLSKINWNQTADPTHLDNFWTVDQSGAVMNVHIDIDHLGDWRQFRMDGSIKPKGTDKVTIESISQGDMSMSHSYPTCEYEVKFNGVPAGNTFKINPSFSADAGVRCTQDKTSIVCSD